MDYFPPNSFGVGPNNFNNPDLLGMLNGYNSSNPNNLGNIAMIMNMLGGQQ